MPQQNQAAGKVKRLKEVFGMTLKTVPALIEMPSQEAEYPWSAAVTTATLS